MWEIVFICSITSILIFSAFIIGLHYGSKIKNNEKIEVINPIKRIDTYFEEKHNKEIVQKEQKIEEINLYNIDNYDGTGLGQKDFPR